MKDLDEIFSALVRSPFRSRFRLGERERSYLCEKGLATVLGHAREFVASRLTPEAPPNDGKQTPFRGHPVFIAQHATATCCRRCLEKWHGIARGHELGSEEQEHVLAAIDRWLRGQQLARAEPDRFELPL